MKHGFLIDMDGVIYSNNTLIKGAKVFIENLQQEDIPFLFMTNNSQRTPRDGVVKLAKLGINVEEKRMYNSAMATASFISRQSPDGTAFVLGEGGLITSLLEHGISIVEKDPDFVVVGEGRQFTLEMVNHAVEYILNGSKLVATNLDPSPKISGWNNLGIKSIVAMLEEATGRKAFSVGKPSPIMMRQARKQINLSTAQTTVIGDTMSTDIVGGIQMGYKTILTLSGVTKPDDLKLFPYGPDLIIKDLSELDVLDYLQSLSEQRPEVELAEGVFA